LKIKLERRPGGAAKHDKSYFGSYTRTIAAAEVGMTERDYRLFLGGIILAALYFDLYQVIFATALLVGIEGVFNFRWSAVLYQLRFHRSAQIKTFELAGIVSLYHFEFLAERAWRIFFAISLAVSTWFYADGLWFIPWFLGFAMFGAGASGVCPLLLFFRWLGFCEDEPESGGRSMQLNE
jgi:hypothetical protein